MFFTPDDFNKSPAHQKFKSTEHTLLIFFANFQAPRLVKHWRMARQDLLGEGFVGVLQAVWPRDCCESIEVINFKKHTETNKLNSMLPVAAVSVEIWKVDLLEKFTWSD